MNISLSTFSQIVEILGTMAFAISGVFASMERKLDVFGITIVAFVTAIGGGTVRDLLIGATPVAWIKDINTLLIILGTVVIAMLFRNRIGNWQNTLLLFDGLGLGLFTIIGIKKGLAIDLSPGICITLGTITGCFGGVIRDILLNRIPALFHKELYATPCIIGGITYIALLNQISEEVAQVIAIIIISTLRIIAYRKRWRLPSL